MKYNNQKKTSLTKIHGNVRSMIEQARQIIKSQQNLMSNMIQNKSRQQNINNQSKFSQNLHKILQIYTQNYKKIKRSKIKLNDQISKTIEVVKDYDIQKDIDKYRNMNRSRQLVQRRNKISGLQQSIQKCQRQLLENDYSHLKQRYSHRYIIKSKNINFLPQISLNQQNHSHRKNNYNNLSKQNLSLLESQYIDQFIKYNQQNQLMLNFEKSKAEKVKIKNKKNKVKQEKQKQYEKIKQKKEKKYLKMKISIEEELDNKYIYKPWQIKEEKDDNQIVF